MLCAKTSGRLPNTSSSNSGIALKSGASSSTPVPGFTAWICRTVSAYSHAPPSGRSSRATPVIVAYRKPIAWTLSATRRGSSRSSGCGRPVSIWQKSQRRGHRAAPVRDGGSRAPPHPSMVGQPASWHTVCRPSRFTSAWSSVYSGPIFARVLIHSGLRSIGVRVLRSSMRSRRRPSGGVGRTAVTNSSVRGREGLLSSHGPEQRPGGEEAHQQGHQPDSTDGEDAAWRAFVGQHGDNGDDGHNGHDEQDAQGGTGGAAGQAVIVRSAPVLRRGAEQPEEAGRQAAEPDRGNGGAADGRGPLIEAARVSGQVRLRGR